MACLHSLPRHGLALLATALLLTGCERAPRGSEFFPLDGQRVWTYRVITEREDETREVETLTLRTLGKETLDDVAAKKAGDAWRRRSDSGVDYWLRSDETGIYRVAAKSDLQADPQPDAHPRYVLKQPYAEGTNWIGETAPYLLLRTQDWPREIRHVHPVLPINYAIVATAVEVKVNGKVYSDCLKVEGRGALHLFVDPVAGFRDVPVLQREWFCPGSGLVRLEREELTGSRYTYGGRLLMELIEES
ncbi:hypothetical protein [Aquariibacter albus]|uniref:hypothetical protein n=1 Tax=Aquariibacter albus TaxID=2759899 RepID=UPI001F20EE1B|nr:hypothetical protein [Aquariibacter albus]